MSGSVGAPPLSAQCVLVTGADGFVGRHLVGAMRDCMPDRGRVISAVRHPAESLPDTIHLDLEDPAIIADVIAGTRPDAIIHLAGQASVAGAAGAGAWAVNAMGTLALAQAAATWVPDCTVMFASSAEVYGAAFNQGMASEATVAQPRSVYARTKLAAEWALADALTATNRLIVARPGNHSGAGQSTAFVIPALASQIAQAEEGMTGVIRVGQLDSRRDFLDVADVVAAYLLLLRRAETLPHRTTINIASGTSTRVGDILDQLRTLARRPFQIEEDQTRMRPSEVPVARVDSMRMRQLGWQPRIPLADTVATVLADQRRLVRLTSN